MYLYTYNVGLPELIELLESTVLSFILSIISYLKSPLKTHTKSSESSDCLSLQELNTEPAGKSKSERIAAALLSQPMLGNSKMSRLLQSKDPHRVAYLNSSITHYEKKVGEESDEEAQVPDTEK